MHPLFRGLSRGHYPCIAIDPPWDWKTRSDKGRGRSPKYDLMSLEEIAALPLGEIAAPDTFLFCWITGPFLTLGAHLPLFKAWGFKPSAMQHVWLKPTRFAYRHGHLSALINGEFLSRKDIWKIGNGYASRQNAEYVVLGRKGSPKRLSASVRQEIIEPVREHSRKPVKFYQAVEEFCAGPRLDVFGRQRRVGWTVVGNQADKFGRAE